MVDVVGRGRRVEAKTAGRPIATRRELRSLEVAIAVAVAVLVVGLAVWWAWPA